ncbi:hypothetical protein WA026_017896 [Henosepilachna vigintioctopunctata]|uniref:Secreted protein n=1 Tax=Henosepilachna vigintioctopunctata TaxID=420089 RepID=A0AAW1TQ30_9CUCU
MNSIVALFFFAAVAASSASVFAPSGVIARSYVAQLCRLTLLFPTPTVLPPMLPHTLLMSPHTLPTLLLWLTDTTDMPLKTP